MAAKEVIHFSSWAQLTSHLLFPTRPPPEPVAKSPPYLRTWQMFACGQISDCSAIPVSNRQSRFFQPRSVS